MAQNASPATDVPTREGGVIVASDEQPNHDFDQYSTYSWSVQLQEPNSIFALNDLVLKSRIISDLAYEMEARGYEQVASNPDLIVSFRVFDAPTEFTGYEGFGTNYFGDEIREPEDRVRYKFDAGTLIVHLIDNKTDEVVWQGYASGLIDGNVFDLDKDEVAEAVHMVMDEYNYNAKGMASNE
ncbi:protein of unknown function [Catalinimonas alkaloidigena]|uniref:DUF4136 domain-containing protein n=1 Tax=Catalinimonas alkaloidigena TaxID=1075417 RepID=A0A1G8WVT8_9BACT|nr:DUF4136 domain-containing protein [Catalinimonas alkaloidigena]SDJ82499.1 protein of unknown function [Catalinimonas alkaloidigena]